MNGELLISILLLFLKNNKILKLNYKRLYFYSKINKAFPIFS